MQDLRKEIDIAVRDSPKLKEIVADGLDPVAETFPREIIRSGGNRVREVEKYALGVGPVAQKRREEHAASTAHIDNATSNGEVAASGNRRGECGPTGQHALIEESAGFRMRREPRKERSAKDALEWRCLVGRGEFQTEPRLVILVAGEQGVACQRARNVPTKPLSHGGETIDAILLRDNDINRGQSV
jgi:hypothetical protein